MSIRSLVGQTFQPDTYLGIKIRALYWALFPTKGNEFAMRVLMSSIAKCRPQLSFVQIGSNDADYGDPLRYYILNRNWRGVMVEPVPLIFERLKEKYQEIDGLEFENVAIDKCGGNRSFFCLKPDDDASLPPWYDQLGSFLEDVVIRHEHFLPDIRDRIVEIKVPCSTVDQLRAKHKLTIVDLIHIDAEGYDYEILASLNLKDYQTSVVLFEHKHLSSEDYNSALELLHGVGFDTFSDRCDTLAVTTNFIQNNSSFSSAWGKVRLRLGLSLYERHARVGEKSKLREGPL